MSIKNVFSQFKEGLYRTRVEFANKLGFLFSNSKDKSDFLEKLEELLILSDLGTSATAEIMNEFEQINFREYKENNFIFFKKKLKAILIDILNSTEYDIKINQDSLNIIMLVGVNGSGKTSVAGKIAYRLKNINNDIIMVPADTFRAAAIQQLKILADKVGVEMINAKEGADPASVVYDGVSAARARKKNIVIIDTAALTKMDGTAKGGIVIAIKKELDIPVKLISCGEKLNNLYDFRADKFVEALLD
jgi:fused signal recognition particle receptor